MSENQVIERGVSQVSDKRWIRPFFTIWIGQALSLVGSQVGGFALVWWLTQETGGSATTLALMTFIAMLPGVVLGPFVGALVDRWNRRRVMMVADSVIALFSAGLAALAWLDVLQVWHVYVIMFVRALGGTFHYAAMQASTSLMVPSSQLARVGGMNQTLRGVLDIATPPLGAMLLAWLPLYAIMGIDMITAVFAVGPLFFVHIPQPERKATEATPSFETKPSPVVELWRDVVGGFKYVWHWQGLFIILLMATVLNMMANPAFSLLPIMVKNHFAGDALQLGWLNSAWGIGLIAGGLALSVWGGFRRKIDTSCVGLLGMGLGTLIVGVTPGHLFWMAWGGMVFAGFFNPIVNAPFMAVLQSAVAPELQGRVFATVGTMAGAASLLGMALAGPVADRFGVSAWFVAAGVACLAMGSAMRFIPSVMRLEEEAQRREANRAA